MKKKSNISCKSEYLRFLEQEKDISDQIINCSRSMLSIINSDYIYEKVNTTFCNAHQEIIDSIVGRTPGDIWGYETFQKSIKENIDLCLSGKIVSYEASFSTPQFGDRFFNVVFRPLPDKTGMITRLLAETFDITDLKRSNQAVLEKNEEFKKFESLGTLAAGIAHDLNNIIATISGYSEMLLEDLPEASELAEKVSKIKGELLKAQAISNQILKINLHSGPERKLISVSEVLKETIGFIRLAIPSNIVVKSRIPKTDIFLFADPTQLFRVFLNLMTNAVKAMEKEGGVLSVKLEIIGEEHVKSKFNIDFVAAEYALLTFKDTGKGMEHSTMNRIFEPFFTTSESGKGAGFGLSVVQKIVSELDGRVLISSEKNKGSVFYIYLPVFKENIE